MDKKELERLENFKTTLNNFANSYLELTFNTALAEYNKGVEEARKDIQKDIYKFYNIDLSNSEYMQYVNKKKKANVIKWVIGIGIGIGIGALVLIKLKK